MGQRFAARKAVMTANPFGDGPDEVTMQKALLRTVQGFTFMLAILLLLLVSAA